MTDQALASPYLQELHERLTRSCDRAESLAGELSADQLNWKPSPEKWSIAQCFEHMLLGVDHYEENLRPALDRARAKGLADDGPATPRHTFMGRIVMRFVEPDAKRTMKAPKPLRPSQSEIAEDVLERFLHSHRSLAGIIAESDGLPLTRIKLSSPELSIVRLNAADAFEILVMHAERHLTQAERVRESEGFPD